MEMTLLQNACVLDANNHYKAHDILVNGQTIVSVLPAGAIDVDASNTAKIDMKGYTVMPGFIDSHVHIAVGEKFSDDALKAWAQNGVTTVRDLGMLCANPLNDYAEWLKSKEKPEYARVVSAGKYIDVEGGYGCGPDPAMKVGIVIDTPEKAADAVSQEHEQGFPFIKIGIQDLPGPAGTPNRNAPKPRLTTDEVRAIANRVHDCGMRLTAHLMLSETLDWLSDLGLDDAAHTPCDEMPDALILKAIKRGIPFTTTLGNPDAELPPFIPADQVDGIKRELAEHRAQTLINLKRIHDAGGLVAVGTDLISSNDFSEDAAIAVHELRQLASAGFTLDEIIRCATLNPAIVLGIDDQEGSIEPGKRANIIATKGRIDDSFSALHEICFVMNRGSVIRDML